MQKRKSGGFTLVELVVVIAVLAFLAGVGVVAYNGYIDYANKGVDRATVGEVIRAIERAGYSDTVPDGNGFVPVILSNGEKGPVIISSDETIKEIITNALTDTYGDLSSIMLKYDGWESIPASETFKKMLEGTIPLYWETITNSDGSIKDLTSYSGHVDEIWDIVSNMVEALDKGNLAVDGVEYEGGKRTDYLTEMVTQTSGYTNSIIEAWKEGKAFDDVKNTGAYLGAKLARNYAFYQFVQEKYSDKIAESEAMKADLEKVKINGKDYTSLLTGPDWTNIMTDYKTSGRAEIDALAYLSLMEAVGSVKAEGVELEDSDYLKEATKLISLVEPALAGDKSMLEMLSEGTTLADAGSSKITIYVTIEDGMMKVKSAYGVAPEDADPREAGGDNDSSVQVAYTESGSTITVSGDSSSGFTATVVIKPGDTITVKSSVNLAAWTGATCTTTGTGLSGNISASDSSITITANADATSGTIVFTHTSFFGDSETLTINVTVK